EGETPNAAAVVEGCKFASRCKYCFERCRFEEPELRELAPGHKIACHLEEI
ncbi:MAG: peptide ABC transporter substrate-binding protein, partial [Clostridiales bacterium]|nr:peptide ABC transporter substrate-binding protein [Clostridiales bacterium]